MKASRYNHVDQWYGHLEHELRQVADELTTALNRFVVLSVEFQKVGLTRDSLQLKDAVTTVTSAQDTAEDLWVDFFGEWDLVTGEFYRAEENEHE